ncbi:hypothetical protein [Halalkalicoccus jeotgali]|uniref:Uncharacterized protein n=1 Tax=Halalkalicoccus jeotgali (strain DSM 18796 / CECT 7217 / JCM 14584 / KCTC 4019 / B3) TaxID=795797 RepID=D8J9U4_HALJB|nr:hypothetical protein [Halalkalicoccus jeotgali]ADJ14466.1 hypothetical protein HacjB3_05375 [Halalkalicoccus jeotgali B3]ELY40180.1 hypothetical protein C497_03750 [Halalkalicoccus jeotgali B3]
MPNEPETYDVTEWDAIPLPDGRLSDKRPVKRTVRDHPAWPGQPFTLLFEWNESFGDGGAWIWTVELAGRMDDATIVERQPVRYADPYTFRDRISFLFVDFSRRERRITPANLGSEVELIALPERGSPGFDAWLARQLDTDENADEPVEV